MKGKAIRPIPLLGFATIGAFLILIAALRGNYLFGFVGGVAYVAMTVCIFWLLARSLLLAKKPSVWRLALLLALSIPLGVAMAYPASIHGEFQHAIDDQATDRAARTELAEVFASDPAFKDLSISTRHLKIVNVTIHGSMDARSDFDRLRDRIASECPIVRRCSLCWDLMLRNPAQRIAGLEAFPGQ